MRISNPELKVVRFSSADVIATSAALMGATISGLFYMPNGSGGYQGASGTFGEKDHGVYELLNYTLTDEVLDQSGIDMLIAASQNPNGMVDSGMGYPIPASVLLPIAQSTYLTYYDNGHYYTNGISYYEQYHQ